MHLRKHNLLVVSSLLVVSPLLAQVNSRDPGRSPDFQTTCDEEVNNERVAKAVPASDPTPTPAPSASPTPTASPPPTDSATGIQSLFTQGRAESSLIAPAGARQTYADIDFAQPSGYREIREADLGRIYSSLPKKNSLICAG